MARSIDTLAVGDPTYIAPPSVKEILAPGADALAKVQQDVAAGDPSYAASLYRAGERGTAFTPNVSYEAVASAPVINPFKSPTGLGTGAEGLAIAQATAAQTAADTATAVAKQKVLDDLDPKIKALKERIALKAGAKVADSFMKIYEDNPGYTADQAYDALTLDKKYNQPYLDRFAGNQTLIAAGKNPLSMEAYFQYEDTMKDYAKAYDMPALATQDNLNKIIGQGLDVTTAASVVNDVYGRVLQDKETLDSFKKYYPMLNTGDIVSSILLGTKNQADVNILNKKITAAQIGGAAAAQGLTVGMGNASDQAALAQQYAASGVTGDTAATAYKTIATELPGLQALGNTFGQQTGDAKGITPGQNVYTQAMAEDVNIKGLAPAQLTRDRLIRYGTDVFSGDAGNDQRSNIAPSGQY